MELDLPKQFEELVLRESLKNASLRKRSTDEQPRLSIKDRIKVREDVKDKRIKVEAVPSDSTDPKITGKTEDAEKTKKDPAKVRCTFWPTCKKPECPFVHPKEAVSLLVSQIPEMRIWE